MMDVFPKPKERPRRVYVSPTGEELQGQLLELRHDMRKLLSEWDEKPADYLSKESSLLAYVEILLTNDDWIHADKGDVKDDLDILEDLVTKLKIHIDESKRCDLECKIAAISAYTKVGLTLQELDSFVKDKKNKIGTHDPSWHWIMKKIKTVDWNYFLYYVHSWKPHVVRAAAARKGDFEKKLRDLEKFKPEINVEAPGSIKQQLKAYLKEEKGFREMRERKSIDCVSGVEGMLDLMERVRSKLSDRHSEMPDDDNTKLAVSDQKEPGGTEKRKKRRMQ